MTTYIHLLISLVHPAYDSTINRYCLSIDANDSKMQHIDIDRWAEPATRQRLLSLLCEDWLTDGCCIVGCEQISGAVQWV
jgi:hypothetical protein